MDVSTLLFAVAMFAQNDVAPPATLPDSQPPANRAEPAPIDLDEPARYGVDRYGRATNPTATADVPDAGHLVPVEPPGTQTRESLFLRHATLSPDLQLDGQAVSLADVFSPRVAATQHVAAVEAYWKLSGAVARYCLCLEKIERLELLATSATLSPGDQAALEARMTATLADWQQCRVDVIAAQQTLARTAALPASARPPLPSDRPHEGSYETRIDAIFPAGTAPRELEFAARLLPVRQEVVGLRTSAVEAAVRALNVAEEQYTGGAVRFSALLAAYDLWSQQQASQINSIVDYNRAIAAYAMPLAPPGTASARLVAMLIKQRRGPTTTTTVQPAGGIGQPTEAVEPAILVMPVTPEEPAIAPAVDPFAATPDRLTPSPDPLAIDLLPSGNRLRRGEPALAPPLEGEPLRQDSDPAGATSSATEDSTPTPADPLSDKTPPKSTDP